MGTICSGFLILSVKISKTSMMIWWIAFQGFVIIYQAVVALILSSTVINFNAHSTSLTSALMICVIMDVFAISFVLSLYQMMMEKEIGASTSSRAHEPRLMLRIPSTRELLTQNSTSPTQELGVSTPITDVLNKLEETDAVATEG